MPPRTAPGAAAEPRTGLTNTRDPPSRRQPIQSASFGPFARARVDVGRQHGRKSFSEMSTVLSPKEPSGSFLRSSVALPGNSAAEALGERGRDLEADDSKPGSAEPGGVVGCRTKRLKEKLAEMGMAGVLAYGILNTAYYIFAFLFFFIVVAKVPRGLGYTEVVRKIAESMALTWAGSQVTKIPRAAGAVAIAPFIDRLLDEMNRRTGLGREKATIAVAGACLLAVAAVFGAVAAAWA